MGVNSSFLVGPPSWRRDIQALWYLHTQRGGIVDSVGE